MSAGPPGPLPLRSTCIGSSARVASAAISELDQGVAPGFIPDVCLKGSPDPSKARHFLEKFKAQAKLQQMRERLHIASGINKLGRKRKAVLDVLRRPVSTEVPLHRPKGPAADLTPGLRACAALDPSPQSRIVGQVRDVHDAGLSQAADSSGGVDEHTNTGTPPQLRALRI